MPPHTERYTQLGRQVIFAAEAQRWDEAHELIDRFRAEAEAAVTEPVTVDTPLAQIFAPRLADALEDRLKAVYVGDLLAYSVLDLHAVRGIGGGVVTHAVEILAKHGFVMRWGDVNEG